MYIFDTSSFSRMFGCYPRDQFPTLHSQFETMVASGSITSTREVMIELEAGKQRTIDAFTWAEQNEKLFTTLARSEAEFVTEIFQVAHFQQIVRRKDGVVSTSADPLIIARANYLGGVVVTEERKPPHGARIPNICEHFDIPCVKLDGFMRQENWRF